MPISASASLTSSSLKGLMTASTFFISYLLKNFSKYGIANFIPSTILLIDEGL
jgi:hypothetical protein